MCCVSVVTGRKYVTVNARITVWTIILRKVISYHSDFHLMGMKGVARILIRVFSQVVHECKSDVMLVVSYYTKQLIYISLRVVSC
jgi:hypothetical protein